MTTNIAIILCSTLLGFCFSLIALNLASRKKQQLHMQQTPPQMDARQLKRLQQKVHAALSEEPAQRKKVTPSFKQTLDTAALATEFQVPRLMTQARVHQPAPEKYTILSRLVSQGLDTEEIASILGISTREAHQLAKLCALAETGKQAQPAT